VTGSFLTGTLSDPHAAGNGEQSVSEGEFGAYWQGQFGGFKGDARVAGGYARFSDQREIYETDSTGAITLDRQANGASSGWTATGHFGASYQWDLGKWFIRPAASGDYFRLYEGGFTEHGGASTTQANADGFDLQLQNRTGYQATGAASLTVGRTIGTTFVWRPQLEVGYRDAFAGTAGDTTARFVQGGSNFTLTPVQITGGGPTMRVGAKADTDFYELDFEAGAEERNNFYEADIRFNIRVLF
jgi:outer membrane autotransporter protein